jgi:hypothetical protein
VKKPSFLQGAAVGFAIALGGMALYGVLGLLFPARVALATLIPMLAAVYLAYLLWRSDVRTGRFATLVLWAGCAVAIAVFVSSVPLAFVVHALLLWLVRSLYFHNGVLAALADLGLSVLAVAAAVATAAHSQNAFLTLWTFFLVQALFVAIPESLASPEPSVRADDAPFRRAQQAADSAFRRLVTR